MLKATRRRLGSPALVAIGLVLLVPAFADAQLFPNRPIRRQKPSCATEPPFNAQVRRDYFGYYPTCWSKFPEGWGCPCPNPELPNPAQKFKDDPLRHIKPEDSTDPNRGDDAGFDGGMAPPNDQPADGPNVPLPDRNRSPFDMDPNSKPPGTRPTNPDPFTSPDPAAPRTRPGDSPPVAPPGNRTSPPTGLMEMPKLPAVTPTTSTEPVYDPGAMVMLPDATLTSNTTTSRPDLGPLPSAPLPAASTPALGGPYAADAEPVLGVPAPAQAPKRRSILGGLFGRNNTRTR